MDDIQTQIEELIGEYCDGTLRTTEKGLEFSLEKAHFIEVFENSAHNPQELADRLYGLFLAFTAAAGR
jgi:hypothetical protein